MIGTAASDGSDEQWLMGPQIRRHFRDRDGVGGQLAADDRAGLRYLRP